MKGYIDVPVGTGIAPSISEIIDYIWNETGRKSVINKGVIPMRPDEPDCIADITVINNICKWEPIFWKEGIRKMINQLEEKYETIN